MSDDEITSITFRLPSRLREKIQTQAATEERSESAFLRYHLGEFFRMADDETRIEESQEVEA